MAQPLRLSSLMKLDLPAGISYLRRRTPTLAVALLTAATATVASHAQEPDTLDGIIRSYLEGRGATVQLAPDSQLARRYAIDLTGVVPTPTDIATTRGMTPDQMFDHFINKGPMPHTQGARPYVWINLIKDADHFLFSNSNQFSQVAHIVEFRDQLERVYEDGWSYQSFARWALQSQMFLNRFPSDADRANASFFLFMGRESLAPEVPIGNMWNGYALINPGLGNGDAETDPDYHVHDFDLARCNGGDVVCEATVWGMTGSTPDEAIELLVTAPMFAEATVNRYWERYMGSPLPGVEFPDVRMVLVKGLMASNFDINWLLRELMTSPAYTQEMMYR